MQNSAYNTEPQSQQSSVPAPVYFPKEEPKSTLISRNITVMGRRTSIRLEPEMWRALKEISQRERCTSDDICTLVAMRKKKTTSLTAAIRVFLMLYFRAAATEIGHKAAGHGNLDLMLKRSGLSKNAAVTAQSRREQKI